MGINARTAPDWGAIGELYEELARVERYAPGSPRARDVEDAITAVIAGRISSTHSRHVTFDAVRRARFLRTQATRKRTGAVAHAGDLATLSRAPLARRSDKLRQLDPVDNVTPEDIVVTRALVKDIGMSGRGVARHASAVLSALLADQPPAAVAAKLCISRSTVDRCVVHLRSRAQTALVSAAAA